MDWKHNDLILDLVNYLRGNSFMDSRMIWVDTQLGPSGSPRPDVYSLEKSFAKPKPVAYEIKISRADFQKDVVAGKWMSYLQYAGAVYFCVPEGLIKKTEIPEGAGLIVRGENGWRSLKSAPQSGRTPDFNALMKLLIKSHGEFNRRERVTYYSTHEAQKKIKKQLGNDVADAVNDLQNARVAIAHAEKRRIEIEGEIEAIKKQAREDGRRSAMMERQDLDTMIADIRERLELPVDASPRLVINELSVRIEKLAPKYHSATVRQLLGTIDRIEEQVKNLKRLKDNITAGELQ